jgi:hypothetical protein
MGVDLEKAQARREEEFRKHLVLAVEGAQHLRTRLAQQYPSDTRNMRSAEALAKLRSALEALPRSHSDLKTLRWQQLAAPQGLLAPAEAQTEFISRYGFEAQEDGNPESFLRQLHTAIENATHSE